MIKFEMSGGDEVAKAFQLLGKDVMRTPAFRALEKSVQPTVALMSQLAPQETGALKASIGLRLKHYKKRKTTMSIVGPRRGGVWQVSENAVSGREPANYAHLVEYGHVIARKKTADGGQTSVTGKPFMRPAWDSTKGAVMASLNENLGREVVLSAERQARRKKRAKK